MQIVDLLLGEIFVQCNVVNVVLYIDFNCLSMIQFVVDVFKVEYIIVVGYYGCGGVQVVFDDWCMGLVDNWLCYVGDVVKKYYVMFIGFENMIDCNVCLCEFNVLEQVVNVCYIIMVMDVWECGQQFSVYVWCYSFINGYMNDLGVYIDSYGVIWLSYEVGLECLVSWVGEFG